MTREQIINRFRHAMSAGGLNRQYVDASENELMLIAKGESEPAKLKSMLAVISLFPDDHWQRWGL